MAAKTVTFETGHEEMIHDAQLDYYGKRLATCSSDRSIRIFDVGSSGQQTLASQIRGHEGPVWQLAWAHPKFGSILASCSYDSRVCIWKEQAANSWIKVYEYSRPDSSINTLAFAPHTFGLTVAVGAADGTVSVLSRKPDNTWEVQTFLAHKGGVNSVSWGPDVKSGSLLNQQSTAGGVVKFERKLLTGGCDNQLRLWRLNEENHSWYELRAFVETGETAHSDWVRDAAFAPSLGMPSNTIASASEDKTVCIWMEDPSNGSWRKSKTIKFDTKVYKVSWSLMGNILAVAQGDNKVSLWKESLEGDWKNLSQAQAQTIQAQAQAAQAQATTPLAPNAAYPTPSSPAQQTTQQHQQQNDYQTQHQQHQQTQQPHQQQQQQPLASPQQMYQQYQPQPPQQQQYQQQQYGGATAF